MDDELIRAEHLPDLVAWLKENPAATQPDGMHFHVHHHYAAPPAPAAPPETARTLAEKIVPWIVLLTFVMIIATVCAVILAAVLVALVVGALSMSVFVVAMAYLIRTTGETQINKDLVKHATRRR